MTRLVAQARALTKDYPLGRQSVRALKGIDLDLERGDFALLLGPSGAGKTTTLNLLGCLDQPSGGELTVAGKDVYHEGRSLSESQLDRMRREHIGLVFTEFFLLPTLTATDNVCLPMLWQGKPDRGRAEQLLRAVGLGHRLTHRPPELSGGEMQRVAIARALVNEPDLLLADEPTGNLDTRTRDEILELLHQLNQERGLTVLIASHDTELARRVPRIIRLEDGQIMDGDNHVS
ncbi:MAG: ABC transporter ATP-binding protein [Armatimonadota bacterium]